MKKYDIVNALAPEGGDGRYLEICTPSTGVHFVQVDERRFRVRHRLMYRCADRFDDGLPITFRTPSEGAHDVLRTLIALQEAETRYDVIFVDPWHSYSDGCADMHGALALLQPDGMMVVHDCNPVGPEMVSPVYRDGAWCGQTYQAFIDVALSARHGGYCTVDCDYGCGVVFGPGRLAPPGFRSRPEQPLLFERVTRRPWKVFNRGGGALRLLTSAGCEFVASCRAEAV